MCRPAWVLWTFSSDAISLLNRSRKPQQIAFNQWTSSDLFREKIDSYEVEKPYPSGMV